MNKSRSYAAGHFLISFDNKGDEPAYLKTVNGGLPSTSLVQSPTGSDSQKAKHISTVEMKPIEMQIGAAGGRHMLEWIEDSWKKKSFKRNGMIVHADHNLQAHVEHWFYDAMVTEIGLPALDAASKDGVYLTVKCHPQWAELKFPTPYQMTAQTPKAQKGWSCCNFRFKIESDNNFDEACDRISKIDALTVKQKLKPTFKGKHREPQMTPTGIEYPNISVYLPLQFAKPFIDWHTEYHKGKKQDISMAKIGALEFLASDLKTVLFTIKFDQMSILNYEIEKGDANAQQVKRVKVELFCEEWRFEYGAGF
jgi:hypothetical protein